MKSLACSLRSGEQGKKRKVLQSAFDLRNPVFNVTAHIAVQVLPAVRFRVSVKQVGSEKGTTRSKTQSVALLDEHKVVATSGILYHRIPYEIVESPLKWPRFEEVTCSLEETPSIVAASALRLAIFVVLLQ